MTAVPPDREPNFLGWVRRNTGRVLVILLCFSAAIAVVVFGQGYLNYEGLPVQTAQKKESLRIEPDSAKEIIDPRVVDIFYATNRLKHQVQEELSYSGERADQLSFGTARVRVPDNHIEGSVERPWRFSVLTIEFGKNENEKDHFVIRELRELDRASFIETIRLTEKDTALVFVHGYNNSFEDGLFRLAQIVFDGQLFDILPILFSWPSKNETMAYSYDGDSAEISTEYFTELLKMLQREAGIKTVHIIAHSMGNRIVLNAIDKAVEQLKIQPLGELIFAAADIDRKRFIQLAKTVRKVARGMTLYASSDDEALWWSQKVAFQMPRAGTVTKDGPVITAGVESIDMTVTNKAKSRRENIRSLDLFGLNTHNTFVSPVIVDISRLIAKGEHPPHVPTSKIHRIPERVAVPKYWRYVD